jgi:alcohol dehydrogenase/L-iditol 2-dehydrogenase
VFVKQAAVVQYAQKERAVEIREIPIPVLKKGHVLIRVSQVAICGTDVHQYLNEHTWPVEVPVVLGHEFSGVVIDVAKDVRSFAPGDWVVSESSQYVCGECHYCRSGSYHLCPHRERLGSQRDGALTEIVCVPERCLHRIPPKQKIDNYTFTESCAVAYHTMAVHADIRPGMSVAILGCGFVGLMCVQLAKIRGANPIILSGLSNAEKRLAIGVECGATHTVQVDKQHLRQLVPSIGDGLGIDVVVDVSGRNLSLKDAIDIVRPGGQILRTGWGPGAYNFSLDPLVLKQVRLQGVFAHNWEMWEEVIKMITAGTLNLEPIQPIYLPMDRWQEGFEGMGDLRYLKVVLEINQKAG